MKLTLIERGKKVKKRMSKRKSEFLRRSRSSSFGQLGGMNCGRDFHKLSINHWANPVKVYFWAKFLSVMYFGPYAARYHVIPEILLDEHNLVPFEQPPPIIFILILCNVSNIFRIPAEEQKKSWEIDQNNVQNNR